MLAVQGMMILMHMPQRVISYHGVDSKHSRCQVKSYPNPSPRCRTLPQPIAGIAAAPRTSDKVQSWEIFRCCRRTCNGTRGSFTSRF